MTVSQLKGVSCFKACALIDEEPLIKSFEMVKERKLLYVGTYGDDMWSKQRLLYHFASRLVQALAEKITLDCRQSMS